MTPSQCLMTAAARGLVRKIVTTHKSGRTSVVIHGISRVHTRASDRTLGAHMISFGDMLTLTKLTCVSPAADLALADAWICP